MVFKRGHNAPPGHRSSKKPGLDRAEVVMCSSTVERDRLYDDHGHVTDLSMNEVLDTIDHLHVTMAVGSFVRPCAIKAMLDLMYQWASAAATIVGGVVVIDYYSFAVVCADVSFLLFDSHAHRLHGALVTQVPIRCASAYVEIFFERHYEHLCFHAESNVSKIGHLTLLQL